MSTFAYTECRPAQLSAYVDFLWHFQGPSSCRYKRIQPNGKVELLVNLGGSYRTLEGRGI